jgi:hypothetical protein
MTKHTLFAETETVSTYPAFINVGYEENDSNRITLTVRSAAKPDGNCGDTVTVKLTEDAALKIANAIADHYNAVYADQLSSLKEKLASKRGN